MAAGTADCGATAGAATVVGGGSAGQVWWGGVRPRSTTIWAQMSPHTRALSLPLSRHALRSHRGTCPQVTGNVRRRPTAAGELSGCTDERCYWGESSSFGNGLEVDMPACCSMCWSSWDATIGKRVALGNGQAVAGSADGGPAGSVAMAAAIADTARGGSGIQYNRYSLYVPQFFLSCWTVTAVANDGRIAAGMTFWIFLPTSRNSKTFHGRDAELSDLVWSLTTDSARVVILGPGGIGKTTRQQ
ncbi:hypothetical protein DFH08DRAFT_810615 [Mycena albidolilacea]|uniref:Uncharacterized protein n=1 Tax=Mycena albidolilacea TaxID=1033008 RepID=A0AAD6ZZL7_9AGAR|nr:hypothetical protein DFH08DRAFT_810615 [Mycena albidolilacea]